MRSLLIVSTIALLGLLATDAWAQHARCTRGSTGTTTTGATASARRVAPLGAALTAARFNTIQQAFLLRQMQQAYLLQQMRQAYLEQAQLQQSLLQQPIGVQPTQSQPTALQPTDLQQQVQPAIKVTSAEKKALEKQRDLAKRLARKAAAGSRTSKSHGSEGKLATTTN